MTKKDQCNYAPLEMEFEDGRLVKINMVRPEYMNGNKMIAIIRQLAEALHEIDNLVYKNPNLTRDEYFKVRFLATTAANEPKDKTDDQGN